MALLPLLFLALLLASQAQATNVCPVTCSCDEEILSVSCINANLDVIPITLNPSIQRLNLKNNRIKTVDAALHFYGELQYVDLAANHLVSVPSESFVAQRKLIELHLNSNKIASIFPKTFSGLKNLTVLSLRGNFLEAIQPKSFGSLPLLRELDLGKNRISSVDPVAFADLTSLRVLYLDDNQLRAVPTPAFATVTSLAELHIGLNGFTTLPDDAFQGLSKLYKLDLVGAGLMNITEFAFRGLSGLRNLGLADNKLGVVPTKQLSILHRLEELSIGQNEFQILEANSFRGLANLRRLEVSGASHLERVEKDALRENLNLEALILSSNKRLVEVEDGALAGLPNLRNLVLRDNGFTTFPESLVAWSELHKVDLAENPLQCSCALLWLQELLSKRNTSQVLCDTPLHLKERSLRALTPDELGCALYDTRQQAIIGAVCGIVVATVLCLICFLAYRFRRPLQDLLKGYKWNNRAISRKEHEYQKTFSDDDYIVRSAQQQHLKPIPVTEL